MRVREMDDMSDKALFSLIEDMSNCKQTSGGKAILKSLSTGQNFAERG
jgi:hypothetical protein